MYEVSLVHGFAGERPGGTAIPRSSDPILRLFAWGLICDESPLLTRQPLHYIGRWDEEKLARIPGFDPNEIY